MGGGLKYLLESNFTNDHPFSNSLKEQDNVIFDQSNAPTDLYLNVAVHFLQ